MAEVICTHEECESILLCDKTDSATTPFIRRLCEEADGSVRSENLDLEGNIYAIQGVVGTCGDRHDLEKQVMCDNAGMTFLRWYVTRDGQATGQSFDTDLAGTDFAPADPVKVGDCCACATSTTQPMCDAGTPAGDPADISFAGLSCPASGTSSNGVDWQVDQCANEPVGSPPTDLLRFGEAGDGPLQTWNFDPPVDLVFDLRPSTNGAVGCVELPQGTEAVELNPGGMTWDPDTRRACSTANTSLRVVNRFRVKNAASLPLNALDLGAFSWGLRNLTVAPVASGPFQFLRHVCLDCEGNVLDFTDTTIDGGDYAPQGEVSVGECSGSSDSGGVTSTTQLMCDVLPAPPATPHTFDFTANNGGITSTPVSEATAPNGVVYSVNQGSWSPPNGGNPGYLSLGNNTDTHQWTFHNGAVDLEFDIRDTQFIPPLLSKYLQFPGDTEMLERTQPNVTWEDDTKRLRRDLVFTDTASPNRFRLTNVSSLALSAPNALASWGLFRLTVTPRSSGSDSVQFLRHITFDSGGEVLSVVNVNLDGTEYKVQGQVQLCG
ncbi:hypothetical protein [Chelativorans salis]|uniref:Uncharacterized protein n=1 Tax=Chelativorans salis TaxID=2978478 RepID=A0ABT2LGE7_9HYPH|nr:hypothetical protein [Chelativorans sp. EGI FJ00035]MCT7373433.1 hypothetical protein [Chelativorans sp. EGI FJ00035]